MCVYTCPGSLDLYNAKIGEFHVSRGPRRRYLYTRMEDRERDEVKAGSEPVRSDPSIHRSNYYPLLHGSGILNSSIFFFLRGIPNGEETIKVALLQFVQHSSCFVLPS